MKKILLTFALAIAMSVPAFAAGSANKTDIPGWAAVRGGNDYKGTQAGTAAAGLSANGIVFSRHNLSSYGEHYQATTAVTGTSTKTGIEPLTVATTEICVFCHTPHFGRTDTAPIWNRGSSATGYVAYGPSGQGGKTIGGTTITIDANTGGSALACLSCHDGVTTLDNLINKPGKSGISTSGKQDAGWVFGEVGEYIGDTKDINTGLAGKAASRLNIGDAGYSDGTAGRTGVASLANDHPINVVYNGADTTDPLGPRASLRATTTTISGITMDNARSNGNDTTRDAFGRSDNLWASKGFISSTATIAEILRDNGKVQCASCHDPHYKNQTNTDPSVVASYGVAIDHVDSDGLFLRRVGGNSNSGVCRTCHGK